MPTYQYECDHCGNAFEELQSMLDKKLKKCPKCKKLTLKRLIGTGSGVIFKGSGFYETDYKGKSASGAANKSSESEVKPDTCGKKAEKPASSEKKESAE